MGALAGRACAAAAVRPVAPVHRLRPNERQWSPPSVIFLDTESRTIETGERDVLGLRLWVARFSDRHGPSNRQPRNVTAWGRTPNDLAIWLGDVTRNRDTVWCFAHNLAFDLTATKLPLWLVRHGWAINDAAVGGKAPWMRLGRGKRVLTVTDSWGWLPLPLEEIGRRVGVRKPPLPGELDSEAAWLARCGADVDILATAMSELMDWWDATGRGNWTITGAATGWNAYRHTATDWPVIVDPDPATVKAERTYVHGGRRGTWAIGEHGAGPFAELDFVAAYPSIAAACPHPVKRSWAFRSMTLTDPNLHSDRWGVTARVLIDTDTARWPVRIEGQAWYPVGRFHADLAGPDIREAARLGVLVSIGPGHVHQLAPNMAGWASWCLDEQFNTSGDTPPAAQIACKNWGRSTIGKWSGRSFNRTALGPAPGHGWGYEAGWSHDGNVPGGMLDLAGRRWWISADGTPDNAYPAVTAWIESEVRVRLGRVIAAIGEGAILQADTDGLIVALRVIGTPAAHGHLIAPPGLTWRARLNWVLDSIDPVTAPLTLRLKHQRNHVHVLGPQHVVVDGQRRFAGMAKSALLGADGRYSAKTWPGLQWQMQHGDPRGYVRPTQTYRIEGPYPTGWILDDRTVVPIETDLDEHGNTVIVPWHRTRWQAKGLDLADVQHPSLARYW